MRDIALLGFQQFVSGLMALTLFQDYRYVRIITGNCFYILVHSRLIAHGFYTHKKKQKKNAVCFVTSVYLRDIANMIFVLLHLNVSRLSIAFVLVVVAAVVVFVVVVVV